MMLIDRMAKELGLTEHFIQSMANGASYAYKHYQISKKSGGVRDIYHPSRKLKALQGWLLKNALAECPVHPSAMAYRKSFSIRDNALLHAKNRYLLRIDLTDFFPSLELQDFKLYAQSAPPPAGDWSKEDVELLSLLMFRHGKLTIGAPTSPILSNILCFDLDSALTRLAEKKLLVYSRYADDLFFSTNRSGVLTSLEAEVQDILKDVPVPKNLKINVSKTKHSSKKRRREVTGMVLGSDGRVYVPRSYKRVIRAMIHKFDQLTPAEQISLAGMISYVTGFEPHFLNSLISKYGFEQIDKVTKLPPLGERQKTHLPKMRPGPAKKSRRSGIEVLKEMLRRAGFDPG